VAGLKVFKIVKRKKSKEIVHDANDVCKSADIPSVLGSLDDYETSYIESKGDSNFKSEKMIESD
tara:strand:- start:218 stop:409 length:192 start_codon:yes stop_codon:yes gene_type:complete